MAMDLIEEESRLEFLPGAEEEAEFGKHFPNPFEQLGTRLIQLD